MPLPFPNSCQLACAAWLGGGMPHWQHGKARICLSRFATISPQNAIIKLFMMYQANKLITKAVKACHQTWF